MRGRFASGILRTVGEEQWVATSRAEFVRLACKIYDDEKARVQYARNLMEKRTRIFNDVSSIKELERIIVNYRELPS